MIVDYSGPFPGGVALKNAGVTDIARYFNSGHSKCITQAEASGAHAVGLGIIALCETTADWLIQSANEVRTTALDCQRTAQQTGVSLRALYCAADWDVPESQYPTVNAGLASVATVIGGNRVGLYAKRELLLYVQERNPGMWFMESAGWDDGPLPDFVHLAQTQEQTVINGTQCDIDVANKADYGQWPAPVTGGTMATLDKDDMDALAKMEQHIIHTLEAHIDQALTDHNAAMEQKITAAIQAAKS